MATKLLTIDVAELSEAGLHLRPGVLMTWWGAQPGLAHLMQRTPLELRRPDGSVVRTTLLQYGASVTRDGDGRFLVPADENGPIWTILFTLPPDVRPEDAPPGTEVWVDAPE